MSHRPVSIVSRMVRVGHLCSLAGLAWIACALAATPARADGPPGDGAAPAVAIIRIDITGDHAPDLMKQLDAALVRTLGEVGFGGQSHASVQDAIRGKAGLADCASPDCLQELPALLGTTQFLRLRVEASSAIYEFEILYLVAEGAGGSIKERRKDSCPVCTSEEFIDRVADNLRTLMTPFRPVPVRIESRPAGARLSIAGRELGSAPYAGTLAPGRYEVRAVLDGHLDAAQVIEVMAGSAGSEQRFDIGMTRAAGGGGGGGGGGDDDGGGFGMWKWPAALAAVGAVAVGSYWISIDGDCVEPVSGGECEELYGTTPQGIVSIGVGAALGVAAGLMFWSDGGREDERGADAESAFTPDVVPTRGGAMGTLRFRF